FSADTMLMRVQTRQHRHIRTKRHAGLRPGLLKEHAVSGELIKVRRFHLWMSIAGEVARGQSIGSDQKNMRVSIVTWRRRARRDVMINSGISPTGPGVLSRTAPADFSLQNDPKCLPFVPGQIK